MRWLAILMLWLSAMPALAQSPEVLLSIYHDVAALNHPGFQGFSAERGRNFYTAVRRGPNGELSCASCHGVDPTQPVSGHAGEIRAACPACHLTSPAGTGRRPAIRREIQPFAPSANPVRFTDPDHAELWFDVNCFYVLGRGCTATEKGDLLTYLLTVK